MVVEKYEREAEQIAKRFYHKDWAKVSGNLRQQIYQMAVEVVSKRESSQMDRFFSGLNREPEDYPDKR